MNTSSAWQPLYGCAVLADTDAAAYHRRWMVIDEHGSLLEPGGAPGLESVQTSLSFGYLALRAPGMLRLDIPLDVIEDDDSVVRQAQVNGAAVQVVDEGDLAAAWFSKLLDRSARLVKVHPDASPVSWPDTQ
jgi:uncharacterized protein YcbX